MGIGNILGKLFGGKNGGAGKPAPEPVEYKGFKIEADPIAEGDQFRTAAYIRQQDESGNERKSRMIRADLHGTREGAVDHAISKCRQVIDEQGERLLDRENC